jgi:hypothetical protein
MEVLVKCSASIFKEFPGPEDEGNALLQNVSNNAPIDNE